MENPAPGLPKIREDRHRERMPGERRQLSVRSRRKGEDELELCVQCVVGGSRTDSRALPFLRSFSSAALTAEPNAAMEWKKPEATSPPSSWKTTPGSSDFAAGHLCALWLLQQALCFSLHTGLKETPPCVLQGKLTQSLFFCSVRQTYTL